ncbi:hypothetical protein [Microbacterium sp. GXF7504]
MARTDAAVTRAGTHRVRTALAITSVVVAVLAVLGAVAWFTVIPHALANLTTRVLEADESVPVGDAAVPVPAGWAVQHPPFEEGTVRLISPDGGLEITLVQVDDAPDAALDGLGVDDARVRERLSTGAQAVHARDGADRLLVAVSAGDTAPVIVFSAHAVDGDIQPYTRTLAGLLDGTTPPGMR